ncbi:hypothetical protein [Alkalibacillus aidingensis]|uniref:hypothetical protein n=1 Tax=Alkalibacillus aidingensis TaxID=2747607 RepID=UPI0016616AB7|nr:hypothetical protein [Alkalibacillus aidingensis]
MTLRLQHIIIPFILILLIMNLRPVQTVAEEQWPLSICVAEHEQKQQEYNDKVLQAIIDNFKLDLTGYVELTFDDLNLIEGQSMHDHYDKLTLQHLFVGTSQGDRRLFIKGGLDGNQGYLLFQRPDGNHVKKTISKTGNVWLIMSEEELPAEKTDMPSIDWDRCEKDMPL